MDFPTFSDKHYFPLVGRYKLLTGQLTHYPPPLLAVSGFPVTQTDWRLLTPEKTVGFTSLPSTHYRNDSP